MSRAQTAEKGQRGACSPKHVFCGMYRAKPVTDMERKQNGGWHGGAVKTKQLKKPLHTIESTLSIVINQEILSI